MNAPSFMFCPRCESALESPPTNSDVFQCTSCEGVLITQSALEPLLRQLTEGTWCDVCPDNIASEIPDITRVSCPKCKTQMENYGYLSTDKVFIDGCLHCQVAWIDADELCVMAALHSRSMESHDEMLQQRARADEEDDFYQLLVRMRRGNQNIIPISSAILRAKLNLLENRPE